MNHIDEITSELYVLKAGEILHRRAKIEAHLRECTECAALRREIEDYYAEVRDLATAHEKALVIVDGWERPRLFADRSHVMSVKHSVPACAFHFAARHPIYSSAFSIAFIFAIVLLLTEATRKDLRPAHVKAVGEFLVVQNVRGNELWRKNIGDQFEESTKGLKCFDVVDIDNDGAQEIIVMSPKGVSSPDVAAGTVLCFDAKGKERWRFQFKPEIRFAGEMFSSDYNLVAPLVTEDLDKDGHPEVVFAVHHSEWWPSAVVRLNAIDGKVEGLYWHPGWISIQAQDVDSNCTKEIIAAGYNNAFKKSCLLILDPRTIQGHAPATGDFIPLGVPKAAEKYYVLLPNPDIYELANHWTEGSRATLNSAGQIEMRAGRILPGTKPGEWIGTVVYFYFDMGMNCKAVKAGDDFVSAHVRLEEEGTIGKKLEAHYFEELRNAVLYWDGDKFVKDPTVNRLYLEKAETIH